MKSGFHQLVVSMHSTMHAIYIFPWREIHRMFQMFTFPRGWETESSSYFQLVPGEDVTWYLGDCYGSCGLRKIEWLMSEWVEEWVNEWKNEWLSERVKFQKDDPPLNYRALKTWWSVNMQSAQEGHVPNLLWSRDFTTLDHLPSSEYFAQISKYFYNAICLFTVQSIHKSSFHS